MFDWLWQPLEYAFMTRAMVAVILVGIVCAIVGSYIVLRGMAFFGDALAHSILPGVAIGYLVGNGARGPVFWGALIAALLSSMGIGAISKNGRVKSDTAIGIIFAGMFALGVALISSVQSYTADLNHFLFGDVLGVSPSDLIRIITLGILVVGTIFAFYKEFLVISFDSILAHTLRLPVRWLEYLLFILIALTIVVSLQTVGVALMVAMLITPAASASLLSRRLSKIMLFAAAIASINGITGLYVSYYFRVASGASIVLANTLFFFAVWLITSQRNTNRTSKFQEASIQS